MTNLVGLFLGGCLLPFQGNAAPVALVILLAVFDAVVMLRFRDVAVRFTERIRRSLLLSRGALLVSSLVVFWGAMEYTAFILTEAGIVRPYAAMTTVGPEGDDWRLAHITADRYRTPDPVLLWRTVHRGPYTAQGFKGPLVETPKPPNVFRIICYGDSNTDGPRAGGWPERLQTVLSTWGGHGPTRFEVLNAGVAGYSSYQGLARFREEAGEYQPDLVVVSFGWNDVAGTNAGPDSSFHPPPRFLISIERFLLRYRFYLVALHAVHRPRVATCGPLVPRVPLDDYIENMRQFQRTASDQRCTAVFLTRPHLLGVAESGWLANVPEYNHALLAFGRTEGAVVLDVYDHFAKRSDRLFADVSHFTADGHLEMARFLARELVTRKMVPSMVAPDGRRSGRTRVATSS